jgi:hypothetical protein
MNPAYEGKPTRVSYGCAALLLLLVLGARPSWAQTTPSEDEIRAAMVSHLPLFVEWPPEKLDPANPVIRVCILGPDPISSPLETAFHSLGLSTNATVVHVNLGDKLDQCHILYVGSGLRENVAPVARLLQQSAVLIVSERPLSSAPAEMVGLPLEGNHVHIQVNLRFAQRSKLTISSKLLHLASVVE